MISFHNTDKQYDVPFVVYQETLLCISDEFLIMVMWLS